MHELYKVIEASERQKAKLDASCSYAKKVIEEQSNPKKDYICKSKFQINIRVANKSSKKSSK